jgi:hypothetical protein
MQHLDLVYEASADEVARRIGKAADIELIADRDPVDEYGHPVAADAAYVDALRAEPGAGRLEVDPRGVAKHVGHRAGQFDAHVITRERADRCGDIAAGAGMLVRHDHDFLHVRLPGPIILVACRISGESGLVWHTERHYAQYGMHAEDTGNAACSHLSTPFDDDRSERRTLPNLTSMLGSAGPLGLDSDQGRRRSDN